MRKLFTLFLSLLFVSISFSSVQAALLPVEPAKKAASVDKLSIKQSLKLQKLKQRQAKTNNHKHKMRLQRRIDRIQEGSAVGLAAVLGGVIGIALGAFALIMTLTGNPLATLLLPMLGVLLGAIAIIFGFVDMRYAESLGLSWGGVVLGIIAVVICIVAIVL